MWHGTGTCREVVAVVVALASKDAESSDSLLACIGKFVSLFLSSSSL